MPHSAPARPDLSVIIVTHNGRDLAMETLRSAHGRSGDVSIEWLVVDSGSSDGTPDAIEAEWPDLHVYRRGNIGFAAANNVALPEARGRFVLLLNPDVKVENGTFQDLVRALDERPHTGAASVVQLRPNGGLQRSIRRFPTIGRALGEALFAFHWPLLRSLQQAEMDESRYRVEQSADWLVGAFLAVRREALDEVGLLDERFFLYAEEADWCLRIHQANWEVTHLPVMAVTHYGAPELRPELAAQLSHSKRLFARKHHGPIRGRIQIGCLALKHAIRLAVFSIPAIGNRDLRVRLRAESLGLRVTLGLAPPPYSPATVLVDAADEIVREPAIT